MMGSWSLPAFSYTNHTKKVFLAVLRVHVKCMLSEHLSETFAYRSAHNNPQ